MNYLALGDSYTIGEGVKNNFPIQLSKKQNFKTPTIIAKTGWTTTDLLTAIKNDNLEESYDFITLLIGVNNQYQGKSRQNFEEELTTLVEFGLSKTKKKSDFYLFTIPNYGITPFGQTWQSYISTELNWYNSKIKNIAKKYNLPVIDITMISMLAKNDKDLLTNDNLHPSESMYKLWVEKLLTRIK